MRSQAGAGYHIPHLLLPRPFIFLFFPVIITSARFSYVYYPLFLPESVSNTHGIHRFVSVNFVILRTSRLLFKILFLCRIKFFIESLNRVKFTFPYDGRKPLFYIWNLIVDTVNLLLQFPTPTPLQTKKEEIENPWGNVLFGQWDKRIWRKI